ncbi:MAG TPA: hypothetical protein DD490_03045, partial [Acidobacteria bacterium]|nr:hypothetical protein [Acidobacteriota bacterium]
CHIAQPERDDRYCTLASYPSVLATLSAQRNNVIRLWTVFNHSPGREFQIRKSPPGPDVPFADEQPFKYVNGKWDLNVVDHSDINQTNLNVTYFDNLEAVVREAFCRDIVVELTLLDPWDGEWSRGPFHPSNTVGGIGFGAKRQFLSFENLSTKQDVGDPVTKARAAQKVAVTHLVRRLKKYPNVLWEVANEADLMLSEVTPAQVTDFQKAVVVWIRENDNPAPGDHPIMVNGHQAGAFAWDVPFAALNSTHYAFNSDAGVYGAIELLRDATLVAARANHGVAFNENKALGITGVTPALDANDVRSEAWEFSVAGGALFDAFSINRSNTEAVAATTQLGILRQFLRNDSIVIPGNYIWSLASMQPTSCNGSSDWCKNVQAWGSGTDLCPDHGDEQTFWATFKTANQYALYIHHGIMTNSPGNATNPFYRYEARACSSGLYEETGFEVRVSLGGCWRVSWINPKDGVVLRSTTKTLAAGSWSPYPSPPYAHDIVVLASKLLDTQCSG